MSMSTLNNNNNNGINKKIIRAWHFGPGGLRGRGGMGRFLAYLVPALTRDASQVQCRVVDTYGPGPFWQMPLWFALAWLRLGWHALCGHIDLVHIHMAAYGSVFRKLLLLLARAFGLPVILHLHGADFVEFMDRLRPAGLRRAVIRTMASAEQLVVIGRYWRDYFTATLGIPAQRVTIIHNGVPDPRYSEPPIAWRTLREGGRLLTLGELGPRKGTPELLAALTDPRLRTLPWTAILAGNGLVEHYRAELQRLELTDRVQIPGWVERNEAWRLLAESDVFLLPSHMEGLPVAILEAMATGLPVITTPVGAIEDAIEDGVTGLLIPVGDTAALSDAILRLLNNPALGTDLAKAARLRFEQQFTIEHTAAQVTALYAQLLAPAGIAPAPGTS